MNAMRPEKTETTVENTGATATDVLLQSQLVFTPGDSADKLNVAVSFTRPDGATVESIVLSHELSFLGSAIYAGKDRPDGKWRLINRSLGLALVTRFPNQQVERCTLSWRARGENRLTASVWSKQKVLQPGERMRLEADYAIE